MRPKAWKDSHQNGVSGIALIIASRGLLHDAVGVDTCVKTLVYRKGCTEQAATRRSAPPCQTP